MVDVEQLRAVRAIAEAGSITGAARQLGMSQPGLSRLVERVEDELDARLFTRGRSGAEPTADGRKLLQFALATLTAYDTMRASLTGMRSGAGNNTLTLKIVASTTPGEYLLPKLASDFMRTHAAVPIHTLITDSSAVAALLVAREYDVGFSGRKSEFKSLVYVPVAQDEIVLAVPATHPFANAGEIEASQLAGERMLRRETGSGTYDVVNAVLAEHGQRLPESSLAVTLGSTQAVLSAVDSGLGVGFVTLRAIEHHSPARVAAVRLANIPVVRDLHLVYERGRRLSRSAMDFIEFVKQQVGGSAAAGEL